MVLSVRHRADHRSGTRVGPVEARGRHGMSDLPGDRACGGSARYSQDARCANRARGDREGRSSRGRSDATNLLPTRSPRTPRRPLIATGF